MSTALTLDTLGQRYSLLPSEVLRKADTLDLWVMDVALSWHDYQTKKSQGKYTDLYSQDDLATIMKKARGDKT